MDIVSLWLVVIGCLYLLVLVVYYVFLVRAILQMLRRDTNVVMLIFAFLALFPLPPTVIMGILVIIIWMIHKKTLPENLKEAIKT